MSGTFRGTFHTSNDSDRISEELFDAFNMDDYEEDREIRHRSKSGSSRPSSAKGESYSRNSSAGRTQEAVRRRKKKKDRQLIAMAGLSVLTFLLIAEILLGIFLFDIKVLPVFAVLIMNLAIGLILGPCFIVAPILIIVVETAAGIFAGQWILALMGVLLLAGAQAVCHLLK